MDEKIHEIDPAEVKVVHLTHFLNQLPVIVFGQVVAVLVVTYLLYGRVNSLSLSLWFGAFSSLILVRIFLYVRQINHPSTIENYKQRVVWHTLTAGAFGSLWGLMGFALIGTQSSQDEYIIITVLLGLVASSVAATANLRAVFIAFTACTLLPVMAKFLIVGGEHNIFLAFLLLFFMLSVYQFELGVHRALAESIKLRFNNFNLIENLTEEKLRAQDSQRNAENSLLSAEIANRSKSIFLAAASHDLRQPTHAVRLLNSALENTDLDPHQSRLVSDISSSMKALEELLDTLLDVSKLDAGTQRVKYKTAYLADVFDSLQRQYNPIASEQGIQLSFGETEAIVRTDVILLERLLSNLVSNAIRYTLEGSVTITANSVFKGWEIQVKDTGVGISAGDQSRIYEEFVQLDNSERDRSKGFGLGLAIVKRTAELLRLPLRLESVLGSGSVFTITVPLGDPNELDQTALPGPIEPSDLNEMLVLIIDDDRSVRSAMELLLKSWGCVVLPAATGQEAEDLIKQSATTPKAIITDLRLRDNENGMDVVARLNSQFNLNCPTLIITGDISPKKLEQISDTNYQLQHKPCDPLKLRHFLAQVYSDTTSSEATGRPEKSGP